MDSEKFICCLNLFATLLYEVGIKDAISYGEAGMISWLASRSPCTSRLSRVLMPTEAPCQIALLLYQMDLYPRSIVKNTLS